MTESSLAQALAAGAVVLDGGLASRLEARGHDLSTSLWSARLLLDDPAEVEAAHRDFVDAGAQVVISASYQVSYEGLAAAGHDRRETEAALRRSVELARSATARDDGVRRWVAASVGPYAASLADGSEYAADHGRTIHELREWHRPRIEVLAGAGADVLALETIAGLTEVEALLAEVSGTGIPVWLSVTCRADRLRSGEDPDEAWQLARDVEEVIAVGVNCTDPGDVAALVAGAAQVSGKPCVAYPNSGETWDPARRAWSGSSDLGPDRARTWLDAGARLVGGCCRVTPDDIRGVAETVRSQLSASQSGRSG